MTIDMMKVAEMVRPAIDCLYEVMNEASGLTNECEWEIGAIRDCGRMGVVDYDKADKWLRDRESHIEEMGRSICDIPGIGAAWSKLTYVILPIIQDAIRSLYRIAED